MDAAVACGVQQLTYLVQGFNWIDVHALDDGRFSSVGFGDDEVLDSALARCDGDGQHSGDCAQAAVETEFADEHELAQVAKLQGAVGSENADGHGQIEA